MESGTVFRVILGILFFIMLVPRRYYQEKAKRTIAQGLVLDRDKGWIILLESLLLLVSVLAIIVYVINPQWLEWSSLHIPDWLRWVGAILGVIGTPLLIWTHVRLGNNFFGGMKIRQGHELIADGPYRWVRHPMYTSFMALGVAYLLLSANWIVGVPWILGTIIVISTRLKEEEAMMVEQFGDEYRKYVEDRGRFLPRLKFSL